MMTERRMACLVVAATCAVSLAATARAAHPLSPGDLERMQSVEDPAVSPDGQWMVFLTYGPEVTGHPENKDVTLRLMSLADKKITVLAKLFGGQGTINVPSWSPDSKQLAFVSYLLIPPESTGSGK